MYLYFYQFDKKFKCKNKLYVYIDFVIYEGVGKDECFFLVDVYIDQEFRIIWMLYYNYLFGFYM